MSTQNVFSWTGKQIFSCSAMMNVIVCNYWLFIQNDSLCHYSRFFNATHGDLSEGRNIREAQREIVFYVNCVGVAGGENFHSSYFFCIPNKRKHNGIVTVSTTRVSTYIWIHAMLFTCNPFLFHGLVFSLQICIHFELTIESVLNNKYLNFCVCVQIKVEIHGCARTLLSSQYGCDT